VFLRPFRENLPEWLATAQGLSLVPTEYKLTVAFVILVIVLLVRPTGIFKGLST
jgi:branched-chain amino acid transport system permease protein